MASAFHWEARRRQMQMERRLQQRLQREAVGAGQQPQPRGEGSGAQEAPPSCDGLPSKHRQDAAKCSCSCNTAHPPQNSGKLLKRHTSTEYTQQW